MVASNKEQSSTYRVTIVIFIYIAACPVEHAKSNECESQDAAGTETSSTEASAMLKP